MVKFDFWQKIKSNKEAKSSKKSNKKSNKKTTDISKRKRKIFKSQREKRREKANRDVNYDMFRGWFGDRDYRTKQGLVNALLVVIAMTFLILGVFWTATGFSKYKFYLANNTTPIGDTLEFGKSEATLKFGGAWTDKNREVTVVKLHYNDKSRELLSTQGKNYKLFVIDDKGEIINRAKLSYGLLGTQGDGFLFINGKLDKRAYQIVITNQLDVGDSSTDSDTGIDSKGENENLAERADELTQSELEESLSKVKRSDVSENGRINFLKNSHKPNVDYIDFRVNAYSDSTKVVNDNFKKANGTIDYSKVLDETTVQSVIKSVDSDIKSKENEIEQLKVRKDEFKERLKRNKDDKTSKDNISSIDKKLEENNKSLENLKKLKEKYEQENFDKSSFGEMQEKFKMIKSDYN
ncbi:hypothetical protein [Staphylococcus chromogenes]|uniref:hypothetical protein n=1 Tax=Staphylococcus chromogenes TaxID=46126 RepID=UPI001890159A|nr:hypothetical protein [Staphylococcus chromogenes]